MTYQNSFSLSLASGQGAKEFRYYYGNHFGFRRDSRLCAVLPLVNLSFSSGFEIISGTLRPISKRLH